MPIVAVRREAGEIRVRAAIVGNTCSCPDARPSSGRVERERASVPSVSSLAFPVVSTLPDCQIVSVGVVRVRPIVGVASLPLGARGGSVRPRAVGASVPKRERARIISVELFRVPRSAVAGVDGRDHPLEYASRVYV